MEIRDATEADLPLVMELALQRCPHLPRALFAGVLRDPHLTVDRTILVAAEEGQLAGTGVQFRLRELPPTQFTRSVVVAEAALGGGLGSALFRALHERLPAGVTDLAVTVSDADERALAVAAHWGYRELQRSVNCELVLDDLPELRLPAGVSVETSNGLVFADEDAVEAMLDRSQTNPEREHHGVMTLAELRAWVAPGSSDSTLGLVVRVDGAPAALSFALLGTDLAQVIYTGVDPAFRGRGLARLAKEALHHAARGAGARVAVTNNAEHNPGIRHVNESLGYQRVSGSVWMHKRLG